MKVTIGMIWERLENKIKGYAINSVGSSDADDLIGDFSLYLIRHLPTKKFKDLDHATYYCVKLFKFRTIDYMRKKYSYNKAIDSYYEHFLTVSDDSYSNDMELEFRCLGINIDGVLKMFLEGYSTREIGDTHGFSKATASRKCSKIREVLNDIKIKIKKGEMKWYS